MKTSRLPGLFLALLLAWLATTGCATRPSTAASGAPWNLAELGRPPAATWGAKSGLVQEVYYSGEPFRGKPTRVFAYVGRPATGRGPFPGMVLVHGGGGKAFREWAEHWAKRGYVAIAMDTAGHGPAGPLPDGGPGQGDDVKFRNFTAAEIPDMWTYHAVADVVRAHSLLRSLPEVDRDRIGLTGISWGGYLTCIVSGIDNRFKVAVPVYGCGFLGDDSYWADKSLAAMTPEARALWLRTFDPSAHVGGTRHPILFLDGSNDFAYPLDSLAKTSALVPGRYRHVGILLDMPHGHIWTFGEVDAFVDAALRGGRPLAELGTPKLNAGTVTVPVHSVVPPTKAELLYTVDGGPWQKRRWKGVPAKLEGASATASLPETRPLAYYVCVTDDRGLRTSTSVVELPARK
jgi:dienelactone hydrolase